MEGRRDFRRANGAPMVSDPADASKTLRYSRPSSYGKNLDDENALTNWRINRAMQGVAKSPALAAEVNACKDDDKETKAALRDKALDRGGAGEAADMGTALHAMTARIEDPDDVWDPPEAYADDLNAYMDLLVEYGLMSEMVEVHMVNDEFRAAGTADRIYRLTKDLVAPSGEIIGAGTLILGDLKTGKSIDLSAPGFCVQIAIYAGGQLYDIIEERRLPTPPIDQQWGLLVHLPVGKGRATLHWVPLQIGQYGAWLSAEIKQWQKLWKSGKDGHDMPPVRVWQPVERLQEELGATVEGEASIEEMVAYCAARIKTIGQYPKAKDSLILWWPEGLPTPKSGKLTEGADIVTLLNLLDKVEANYNVPFMHDDPRKSSGHKSQTDRSNERGLIPQAKEAQEA